MTGLFAFGPAEAEAGVLTCVGYVTYILVATLALAGLLSPRRFAARGFTLAASAIAFLDACQFMPWMAFDAFPTNDPKTIGYYEAERTLAYWWLATITLLITAIARAVFLRNRFELENRRIGETGWELK